MNEGRTLFFCVWCLILLFFFLCFIANLQHIILESHERWLNAQEILEILLAAEANIVPISTPPVVNAEQTGLFVYNRPAYHDHGYNIILPNVLYMSVGN